MYADSKQNESREQSVIEQLENPSASDGNILFSAIAIDPKLERRITRKIDFRLIPILAAIYTFALIDRTNIGAARISGIDAALDLKVGNRVSIAILVFYIGYIVFELPSNIILKKLGPATWLSFLTIAWGAIVIGMGYVPTWKAFAMLRVMLGILEAGLYPGCIYLIASWYKRYEVQKRIAVFFMTASFLSSLSNILAYGLIQIADNPSTGGWKWIFVVEGAITVGIGILAFVVVVDFPESKRNKFLSAEEKAVLRARLQAERGSVEGEQVNWKVIAETVKDWQVWGSAVMYMSASVGIYSFLIFLPVILRAGLGFSLKLSFLLSAPPAAFSVIFALVISWLADKYQVRGPFVFGQAVLTIIGLAMIGFIKHPIPRYLGAFLGQAGSNALVITCLTWGQNNIRSDAKRSVTTAIQVMMASIGGIYSALVFRQQDAPNYIPGIIATGSVMLLTAILAPTMSILLRRANAQADAGHRILEGSPAFRYTW
ncbi:hypothetical protein LTR84_005113 [Exophiala bonariae]|uniref:Major facilitator superfamily (MFS) profile domain-containing protein n=1 Tax=Exophiala bonariae TaxID=1690606 RepID=A0AAV9NPB3_9EURO|nr:hypothetical protein LTR84_005113 [Exophiala bonariae]